MHLSFENLPGLYPELLLMKGRGKGREGEGGLVGRKGRSRGEGTMNRGKSAFRLSGYLDAHELVRREILRNHHDNNN
jgi:hypothetical protein